MIDPLIFEEMIEIRRDLHKNPETGFDVERTAGIVAENLEKLGLKVARNVGKTGVVADLIARDDGRCIAFRADMDALPMEEENDRLPYRSEVKGKAHMCGHDGHTAILLGAAKYLSSKKEHLKKNIRFIFQPSEEQKPGGAPGMIADGCLDGVSEIYGLHVWPWLETGKIGICPGPMLAQSDNFDIWITGKGGHAAAPQDTVDPLVIGSQIVVLLQNLISRMKSPLDPAVLSVTRFEAGSAYNVIASHAKLSGTLRTFQKECLEKIKHQMNEMIVHTALAFEGKAEFVYSEGYPPLINHAEPCRLAAKAAGSFLEKSSIVSPAEKAMFGEDFAYYLEKIPGAFLQLGCRNESKNCIFPLHHPQFNLDEECLKVGVRLFAELAFQ